ncbi:hypothetical protein C8R43DRAFT_1138682 [Mycena crocata]|nr:hypothetical protein C8R43DRAFT_1138682 [Mycena crocata]
MSIEDEQSMRMPTQRSHESLSRTHTGRLFRDPIWGQDGPPAQSHRRQNEHNENDRAPAHFADVKNAYGAQVALCISRAALRPGGELDTDTDTPPHQPTRHRSRTAGYGGRPDVDERRLASTTVTVATRIIAGTGAAHTRHAYPHQPVCNSRRRAPREASRLVHAHSSSAQQPLPDARTSAVHAHGPNRSASPHSRIRPQRIPIPPSMYPHTTPRRSASSLADVCIPSPAHTPHHISPRNANEKEKSTFIPTSSPPQKGNRKKTPKAWRKTPEKPRTHLTPLPLPSMRPQRRQPCRLLLRLHGLLRVAPGRVLSLALRLGGARARGGGVGARGG